MRSVKGKVRFMKRLLLSFFIVLLIPVISYLIAYRQTERVVTQKTREYTFAMLNQIREVIDGKWEQFDLIAYNLNLNPKVKSFVYATVPLQSGSYYSTWDLQNEIQPYSITDDFIEEMGIYFLRSNRLIMTQQVVTLQDLYEKSFKPAGDLTSFDVFNQRLAATTGQGQFLPDVTIAIGGKETRVLPFVRKLPLENSAVTDGYLVYFLSVDGLEQMLRQVDVFQKGTVYITDGEQPIWQITNNTDIEVTAREMTLDHDFYREGDNIVAYVSSNERGWKYCIEIPSTVLMDSLNDLQASSIRLLVISLVVGGCLAFLFAARNNRPIARMASAVSAFFSDGGSTGNEIRYLEGSVQQLIQDNSRMEAVINSYYPILKMDFLDNLYRGEYNDAAEIEETLQSLHLTIRGSRFLVLVAAIPDGYEMIMDDSVQRNQKKNNSRVVLSELIREQGEEWYHCSYVDKDKIAVLIAAEESGVLRQTALSLAATAKQRLEAEMGMAARFFGGTECGSLTEASQSYTQARAAYEYFWDSKADATVYWYSEIPHSENTHQYPMDVQVRLMNLVGSGKVEEIQQVLDRLYEDNFMKIHLPVQEKAQLLIEMRGTLLKLYDKFKIDYSLFHIYVEECGKGEPSVFQHMVRYFISLCRLSNQMRSDKARLLRDAVLSYIDEHYSESSLSLARLCDHFSMGEAALSQFFKDHTGENISQYIEDKRMEHAALLIRDSGKSIQEIALEVGYNSDKSFRRAFKRVKGVSPSDYRRMD